MVLLGLLVCFLDCIGIMENQMDTTTLYRVYGSRSGTNPSGVD